jgi:hypothetical protein
MASLSPVFMGLPGGETIKHINGSLNGLIDEKTKDYFLGSV